MTEYLSDQCSLRLHISPFSPGLLSSYLTTEQQTLAYDISYHNIQTFPEKDFGYLTLPAMEANKVKKKFNGTTLKGSRVRVQVANPEKRKVEQEEQPEESSGKKRRKKSTEHGVLPGFQLPTERVVKRGWTDPDARPATRSRKDKKGQEAEKPKQQPSKYTKRQELLFRTKLPPPAELPAESNSKPKKKSKRDSAAEVVVHEFENTQQFPAFLKSPQIDQKAKIVRRFVEGEGWLDEEGNCVEEVKSSSKHHISSSSQPVASSTKVRKKQVPPKDVSSEPEAQERNTTKSDPISPATPQDKPKRASSRKSKPPALELKPSQNDKSPEPEASDVKDKPELVVNNPTPHPLESLYKRSKNDDASAVSEPFKFFNIEEADETTQDAVVNSSPHAGAQTPASRGLPRWSRSGAPTPDTAYGRRRFSFSRGVIDADDKVDEEDEEEEEKEVKGEGEVSEGERDVSDDPQAEAEGDGKAKGEAQGEESSFSKWFWENRGDNNRAWKKRRRESLREVRKRENKRLSKKIL